MKRIRILRLGLFGAVALIMVRLFTVQILQHQIWVEKANKIHLLQNEIVAERGKIYMLDGKTPVPAVLNEAVWQVVVDPQKAQAERVESVLQKYAQGKTVTAIAQAFTDRQKRYVVLAKNLDLKQAEAIKAAKLTGVWLEQRVQRVYVENELGAGILGFVNAEGKGQYGIEGALNQELAGENGLLKTIKDVNDTPLTMVGGENVRKPARPGKDIVLTIDRNIQHETEKIAREYAKKYGAENLAILVLDPRNGAVEAMVNYPGYDPAQYGKVQDAAVFVDKIAYDPYEPASMCKVFAFATGIEEGVMTPASTFYNNDEMTVEGWPIRNVHQGMIGQVDMQKAFNFSLNTGSTQILRWLGGDSQRINRQGREILYRYYTEKFGLGKRTGIEIAEAAGLIIPPNQGEGLNSRYANMTFGQGLNITMLQVGVGVAAVVNGGEYFAPRIVAGEMQDGQLQLKPLQTAKWRSVSAATSKTMREMLYGTRGWMRKTGVDRPEYYVGGKTGTAQVIRDGRYVMDETVAGYVGFTGRQGQMPESVVVVRIWGKGKAFAGEREAQPVFNAVSQMLQDYSRVRE